MVNMVRVVVHNLHVSNTFFVCFHQHYNTYLFFGMLLASIPFDLYPLQMSSLTILYSLAHDEVQTPPLVGGPLLPCALSATRIMQTSLSMPTTTNKPCFAILCNVLIMYFFFLCRFCTHVPILCTNR